MKGTELIDRVAAELADTNHDRWSRDDVADFVTWAQAWVVAMRPDVFAGQESVTLAAGSSQSLSSLVSDGWRLISGHRNQQGNTLKTVTKDQLDAMLPEDWPDVPSGTAYYVAGDPVDPDQFWVWPPAAANDSVDILVAKKPTDVTTTNESNEMDVPEYVREPIIDYALGLALRRETSTGSVEQAAQLQARAEQFLARLLPMPGAGAQQ